MLHIANGLSLESLMSDDSTYHQKSSSQLTHEHFLPVALEAPPTFTQYFNTKLLQNAQTMRDKEERLVADEERTQAFISTLFGKI